MFFRIAKKHQKFSGAVLLAVFVLVVFGGVLAPVFQAQAGLVSYVFGQVEDGLSSALVVVINLVLKAFFYVIGVVLSFEFKILEWVLSSFSWENSTVTLGWGIVRDFSNLFFIVVIMIIAFATVLQLETYGMKALLPKLIAIALLINFSLAICGFLINFADAFGKTFIDAGGGGPALTLAVSSGLGAKNIVSDGAETSVKRQQEMDEKIKEQSKGSEENRFVTIILSFALSILSGLIMIFVIGAGIFFMVIRQISLMFIVILSPIALICLLVPFLNDKWSEWKSAFLKWVMFYPLYMFFFYIAIKIINSKAISTPGLDGAISGFTGITSPQAMWRMFIASMFLIGAIVVAQKTGVAGAGAIGNFGMKQLKDFTGVTRAGKAFEAAGKRREERREERRTLGLGAQLRKAGVFGRGAKERAIIEGKEAEKKIQGRQDKLYGIKRGKKGGILKIEDEGGLRKATNKKTILGTRSRAEKTVAVKTLEKWEAQRGPANEEEETTK